MSKPTEVSVLAEFDRAGISYVYAGDDEIKSRCPFHNDSSPSCCTNVKTRVFNCPVAGCGASGDVIDLLARYLNVTRGVMFVELGKRYNFEGAKTVDTDLIERWHSAIWSAGVLMTALRERAVTDEIIRERRFGAEEGRVTIPIKNESGYFVNVRRYLPGAPGKDKMRNMKGRGQPRWYPAEQLSYDKLMICGGEMKAVVAAKQLNKHGIGAVTPTAGEAIIDMKLVPNLRDKILFHCLDVDKAGRTAAEQRCNQTFGIAAEVRLCSLPLDIDQFPKGDINDFVYHGGDLLDVINSSVEWTPSYKPVDDGEVLNLHLSEAAHAKHTGRRVNVRAVVSAMSSAPYPIPKETRVKCDRSQPVCTFCPVYISQSDLHSIPPESPALLEMIDCSKSRLRDALMNGIGIPRLCKVVDFEPTSFYNAQDVRMAPQLEITNRAADRVMQPAVCIGDGLELNEAYDLTGRMFPHPGTQQATLLMSEYAPANDALSTYECDDDKTERLLAFQPEEWSKEGLSAKLDSIYEDLETNVTRIYKRRATHLTVDLAYHSPLLIGFDDRTEKGWVETLIVGDSACGKSEVACGSQMNAGLMTHYRVGTAVACKNASVAGLLGGLENLNGKHFVSWGIVPTHDKRLVILEEVKGMSTDIIAKFTDMRSSGIAELPKIEKRKTHARTRLVWLANPRSERDMSTYNFGIEVVRELIGAPEDVRRFDMALIVAKTEIPPEELNVLRSARPQVEHRYTSDLCLDLVLWAWTRGVGQVAFDRDVTQLTLKLASELCEQFTDDVPLVDRGTIRLKLARLSAALACRTFSCDDERTSVVVRPCHVQYVYDFLVQTYGGQVAGYKDFTEAKRVSQNLIDADVIKKYVTSMPYPKDFIKSILHTNNIDSQDIQDWCAWDRTTAQEAISFFVRKHALVRHGRNYHKQAKFIELLKAMLDDVTLKDRPQHVGDAKEKY